MLPNKPRGVRRSRWPPRARWHRLGSAFRCAMARPAGDLWSPHDLLQSLRSVDVELVSL